MTITNSGQALLRIGQLHQQSGVPIKTIRYYEELGLLQTVARSEGGFRLFEPVMVQRLGFIKRSQTLGLSLAEIGEILQIYDRGEQPCANVKAKLNQKVKAIDEQIHHLSILRTQLKALLQHEPGPVGDLICPIIQGKRKH